MRHMELEGEIEGLVRAAEGLIPRVIFQIPILPEVVKLTLKVNRQKTYIVLSDP